MVSGGSGSGSNQFLQLSARSSSSLALPPIGVHPDEWIIPTTVPDDLVRALRAQGMRSRETGDAMEFAQTLVNAYGLAVRRNETWGMATGYGKRKKLMALVLMNSRFGGDSIAKVVPDDNPAESEEERQRKAMIADALEVAVDGVMADKRVLKQHKIGDESVVDLPYSVDATLRELEDELDQAESKITWVPPCLPEQCKQGYEEKRRAKKAKMAAMIVPSEYGYEPEFVVKRPSVTARFKARGQQVMLQARWRRTARVGAAIAPASPVRTKVEEPPQRVRMNVLADLDLSPR